MYKFDKNHQFGLADFNQPMGLKMNPENRWVKKAEKDSMGSHRREICSSLSW